MEPSCDASCFRAPPARLRALALAFALGLGAFAAPLAAQNYLYVEHDGRYMPVRRADGHTPYVLENGQLVEATEGHFLLRPAEEYLPLLIDVSHLAVNSGEDTLTVSGTGMVSNSREVNRRFSFAADLTAPVALPDVFVVITMDSPTAGSVLFLQGVGPLEARRPRHLTMVESMSSELGAAPFAVHIFAGGREVLNTKIAFDEREAALDRMVLRRIAGVQNAEIQAFAGPVPEYPPALLKTRAKGQAVVSFRVGQRGGVFDPAVVSASDPSFGEEALKAIRLWRFLPRVRDGSPVAATAQMPFEFSPPP